MPRESGVVKWWKVGDECKSSAGWRHSWKEEMKEKVLRIVIWIIVSNCKAGTFFSTYFSAFRLLKIRLRSAFCAFYTFVAGVNDKWCSTGEAAKYERWTYRVGGFRLPFSRVSFSLSFSYSVHQTSPSSYFTSQNESFRWNEYRSIWENDVDLLVYLDDWVVWLVWAFVPEYSYYDLFLWEGLVVLSATGIKFKLWWKKKMLIFPPPSTINS